MGQHTPLYEQHIALGAEMSDINGWMLPLHFGSQVDEHHQVRKSCGVFDVSFTTVVDVFGKDAKKFLQHLLANDISLLEKDGHALYSAMLNESGGVIDGVLVYLIDEGYRLVCNTNFTQRTILWIAEQQSAFDVQVQVRDDLATLAIQGPKAIACLCELLDSHFASELKVLQPLHSCSVDNWFISRAGYSGEDGVEIILPITEVAGFWLELIGSGIMPIGMKARDTLRLEAGFNLYGQDMDESVSPLACNMDWAIAWTPADRNFIGRAAIDGTHKEDWQQKLIGLVSEERGTLHNGQPVKIEGIGEGIITSTNFSPTIGKYIALARVPEATGNRAEVEIKGKWCPVRVVSPRFVWHGKILI